MDRELPCTDPMTTAAALRAQLNQLAAASQALERTTNTEKGCSYLAVINQGICRMLRLVSRMELSQRLREGGLRFSPRYQDLVPALDALCARLNGILSDIGVSLTLRCPDRLYASADTELLRQLLLELVSGLALAGVELTLTAAQRGNMVCFTVSDSGPGQAEGRPVLPAALERQEEEDGLELARLLAEQHGGTLMLSPGAERSMTLAVSIPVGTPEPGALNTPQLSWHSGGFDQALVALSELLPARSFLPTTLG